MARHGDISAYIALHGYVGYAKANIAAYLACASQVSEPTVLALSSGFMTYPMEPDETYGQLRRTVEHDPDTVLLLPSFELEACCELIVQRQLSRPYLRGDRAAEHARIRTRLPIFMALRCKRVRSSGAPDEVVDRVLSALGLATG